ncbi:8-oxo-dGTP diphosphatase MutT [Psychromonas ossibalaenae]|uniref:8-oxo-dGTP diphosphatase MutT n=1 Tax=Psychromonas ossibalaenae TaxID=444922 RepID=UPI000376A9CB|nr:8-oxo-dGTP diphosphatase MutT [Psychromonas ossibalaenae]
MAVTEISIAIVKNKNSYLICLRPDNVHQGGKWEFPGGKVENNESAAQAMCRELKEEVGITAADYQLFEEKFFDYGDKQLQLNFFLVSSYSGEAHGKEGQPVKWVSKAQLCEYQFPEANKSVIAKL